MTYFPFALPTWLRQHSCRDSSAVVLGLSMMLLLLLQPGLLLDLSGMYILFNGRTYLYIYDIDISVLILLLVYLYFVLIFLLDSDIIPMILI